MAKHLKKAQKRQGERRSAHAKTLAERGSGIDTEMRTRIETGGYKVPGSMKRK